jgi:uncharacterized membrane protein YdbT with pleckstrin-like domain
MLCPDCKTQVPADAAFCPKCGRRMSPAGVSPADKLRTAQSAAAASSNDPEQTLWHGGYSFKAMYGYWLVALLVTIAALVASVMLPNPITWLVAVVLAIAIWVVFGLYYLIMRLSVDYTLTNQRFIHKRGLLSRVTNRVEVIDIDDVTYEQGLVERMFGVGTIKMLSSDVSDPKLLLPGIDDVQRVSELIDRARREERRRRGLYVETV